MPKALKNFERAVSNRLNEFPALKAAARKLYMTPLRLWGSAFKKSVWDVDHSEIGEPGKESFYGYFDLWPENDDGLLLSHQSNGPTSRAPDPNKQIEIAVFQSDDYQKPLLTRHTFAYNWQQGSRLQWIDNDRFIYNDFERSTDTYVARVINVKTLDTEVLTLPIQCLIDSHSFLAINYHRLALLRPDYGYFNLNPQEMNLNELDCDGIWKYEIEKNTQRLIYSLRSIVEASGIAVEKNRAKHKVNHVLMAPDGFRFVMIHREFSNGKRSGHLLLGDINGGALKRLSTKNIVSHYCWMSNSDLLVFMDGESGFKYYLLDTFTGKSRPLTEFSDFASGDGHPAKLARDLFVTDTYPDRFGYQRLLLGNTATGAATTLAALKHPSIYSGVTRCDLHPRVKIGHKYGFLDSVCSGFRRLYRFGL